MVKHDHYNNSANNGDQVSDVHSNEEMLWAVDSGLV